MLTERLRAPLAALLLLIGSQAGLFVGEGVAQEDLRPQLVRASELLHDLWRSSGVPSVTVAVAKEGRLVFTESVGYADVENLVESTPSTAYNIGSVSKVVTAVAVMQLVERGAISLDDPVTAYVPAFSAQGRRVTIRQIMTHTSGIRHYRDGEELTAFGPYPSFADALAIFKDDPLRFEPGKHYLYSTFGVSLLRGVIEAVSGLDFETYMRENVWLPAGMLRTSLDVPWRLIPARARGYERTDGQLTLHPYEDASYKYAGGGMVASVEDLIRFGLAVRQGRLLDSETVDTMFTPQHASLTRYVEGGSPRPITRWGQALLWRVRQDDAGRPFVYHCGTVKGFNSCLVLYLDIDIVVAIANNVEAIGFGPALEIANLFRE